ncbi:hypothetical protein F5J12DRAFT_797650 [Pisolithus orientalis]|uniref:uncharacterized protein n=1 Tax=Pisolithus orientalis TaxID=936130 RepID=UPI002223F576|nr:uncharacterized protein F5J12DRAFT_797650 [Pisolithus orientalis]KAI6032947.1 hypothetical protein F5J12DRAFT_797650 [Pisolithus orientalis]
MSSDNEAVYGVGRRAASSSSRESSPTLKRQRRSFTPNSDDGDLVVPVTNQGENDTPESSAPLIRKPVGFSWTPSTATVIETYEAALPPKPTTNYFLPGQAPPPPPKQPTRRTKRKKKGQEYSAQTGRFRVSTPTNGLSIVASKYANQPSASLSVSSMAADAGSPAGNPIANTQSQPPHAPSTTQPASNFASGIPVYRHTTPGARTTDPSDTQTTFLGRSKRPTEVDSHDSRSSNRPFLQPVAFECSTREVSNNHQSSTESTERISSSMPVSTRDTSSSVLSVASSTGRNCSATSQCNGTDTQHPLRMVTLLIEDYRSGVQDSQLAEIMVPLKAAENPEDGFWADAVDVCDALQASPSRIDGPAKVYTKRAKYRQFFMRVDQHDNHHSTPAHLGVSIQRTLDVFVEAPGPQGQLPRPPRCPKAINAGHRSGSDSDVSMPCTRTRSNMRVSTRDERIESFEVNYATTRGRSSRASDTETHRRKRGWGSTSSITPLSTPSHLAETEGGIDDAITKWIKPQVEGHPGFLHYMQSKAKPQSVSEVLNQFDIVDVVSRQLSGLKTPADWAGAPNCSVKREHVLRSLCLDSEWDTRCQEIMNLVSYYGKNGTQYQDPRVIDMMNDTAVADLKMIDKFLELLKTVHRTFTAERPGNAVSQCDSVEEE